MNPRHFFFAALVCAAAFASSAQSQDQPAAGTPTNADSAAVDAKTKSDADLEKKAADWVGSLKPNVPAKETGVQGLILPHSRGLPRWNNEHPYTTVPAGINPVT